MSNHGPFETFKARGSGGLHVDNDGGEWINNPIKMKHKAPDYPYDFAPNTTIMERIRQKCTIAKMIIRAAANTPRKSRRRDKCTRCGHIGAYSTSILYGLCSPCRRKQNNTAKMAERNDKRRAKAQGLQKCA